MERNLPWNLILSKLQQRLSPEEEIVFNKWLKLPDNHQVFLQIEMLWKNVQQDESTYEPDMDSSWKKLSARIQLDQPEIAGSAVRLSIQKGMASKRFLGFAAVASVFLMISFYGAYYLGKKQCNEQRIAQTFYSMTGKSKVILPDGSEVWLHSNTSLSYNSNFRRDARMVTLIGEAYFNVKHDAQKPFVVKTNDVSVEVHGTKFNVNAYASSANSIVSLYEGSVSMKAADQNILLQPGEEGNFNKQKNTLEFYTGDVDFAKSWSNDYLKFKNKNLREVCRYLSKWYAIAIDIDPSIDNMQSYTFTLHNETSEEVIEILASISSLDYRFDENKRLLIKKKKNEQSKYKGLCK